MDKTKETIEEAIREELESHFFSNSSEIKQAEYFIKFGAKWQQEQEKRKYTEEEVYSIIDEVYYMYATSYQDVKGWFEEFKKR